MVEKADQASDDWTNPAAGLEVLRAACDDHPDEVDPWLAYATAFASLERWSEAEAVARKGLEAAGYDLDLWVLVLDALIAQELPDLILRELDGRFAASAPRLVVDVYRAQALELRGDDPDGLMAALSDAYDDYGSYDVHSRAPQQAVLDLALLLGRHGARDEADFCLETISREAAETDTAWHAAAAGVAPWDSVDEETAAMYRERLERDGSRDEAEIEEAIADANARLKDE
jgi:hypothetical protein